MFSQRTNWKLSVNRFTQALQAIRASGTKLLDLTISNPTDCGLQYDTAAILAAYQNPNALRYDPQPKGLLSAREEVARYYLRDHHVSVNPESILLTTSTSEAYSYVFRLLCNPQDEILVPKPSYPLAARRMGVQGRVLVRVLVSSAGLPQKVELKQTSGSSALDRSAMDAVTQWRFVPARQGEKTIDAWIVVPIVFTLKG